MSGNGETAPRDPGYRPVFPLDRGPIEEVHAFWLAGMSCDGCTIAAAGAQNPTVEQLMSARLPGLPKIVLHHPVLSVTAGKAFMKAHHAAREGTLGAPYVVLYEGSVADERIAGDLGGYWSAMGAAEAPDGSKQPIPTAHWLRDLAPGAAAVIAVGTCATWGGVPAAAGNVTGSMSVMDYLGKDYLSALGLPPINIPGCAPVGDNITETIAAVLMFLAGFGPLPEFDELGRPKWLFGETVHRRCVLAGNYEEGKFAQEYGERQCLVELGCWGPVVQCNIVSRGALGHAGGCMNTGGICIGCTMPGFPDAFAPFYKKPPGSTLSATLSRTTGSFVSYLRQFTQKSRNRTPNWARAQAVPSGWANVDGGSSIAERAVGGVYDYLRRRGTRFEAGSARQRALQAPSHRHLRSGQAEREGAE
ncbi:hydrogenase expression protein HypE [Rhodobacteraceae bacterium 2CG4]|uniref:hydrogenase (acceptor) n=1 Tax=Halovulum marinum TaxID=2662447 RepID=A0A6L5Z3S0_9RHOB|nr:hydrogenase expression protein HypE [Halovulum marinum]MSU91241.1 hydrogenase expression protein HypE [Halovulum marinum]